MQAIEDSYEQVPKERKNAQKKTPPMDIKMDSDRDRIHQRNQGKFSSDATEPLKKLKPDYDLSYLKQTLLIPNIKKLLGG